MNEKRAIIIHVSLTYENLDIRASISELEELLNTLEIEVVARFIQKRKEPNPAYFIGYGKLEEIKKTISLDNSINLLVFNNEISMIHTRNLEKELGIKVITRSEVILEIFSLHARTEAAKLQVELAKLEYQLPRIIGKGIELSRLGGKIGTRGPGEQKLEIERRAISRRIDFLKKKLLEIEKQKNIQRKKRFENAFKISLAGYTNSGKSSLLKTLTKTDVLIKDKLFVTLDTKTKKLWLEGITDKIDVVVTDTVGFIRDIPHTLIESFKSTLMDTVMADLVIHLVDASDHDLKSKIKVVDEILGEIGVSQNKVILCFNKIDLLSEFEISNLRKRFPKAIFISAMYGYGIEDLKLVIKEKVVNSSIYSIRSSTSKPTFPSF